MSYVDGYLVPLPKRSLRAYKRMAILGRKIWMKHGALDYQECAGDDLFPKWGESFAKMMKLKRGETVVFAYIVYKSRAHRNQVNKKVMKDMNAMGAPKDMPFDMKRMLFGGFKTLVE